MTKSTITREQLIKKAQEQIEFCRHTKITGEGRAHVNQCAALFEIALAAMDSEPVTWGNGCDKTVPAALRFLAENERPFGGESRFNAAHLYHLAREIELMAEAPLYRHAQPVPVVSADLLHTAASAIEDLLEHTDPNTSYYSAVWADVPGKLRAAMLAAAPQSPGSEPAAVPGKWIPVSERMPERGDWLVTDGCDFDVQLFDGEQFIPGFVWEDKITHWMPLPATPQEVK
ncbi:Eaa1 [Klebsiella pneumoniae]|nr:DUF551 domain-containing protein [Klebsiella pneumoniae]STU15922.1 Eaa1 [Klebsiella pneumoniae]